MNQQRAQRAKNSARVVRDVCIVDGYFLQELASRGPWPVLRSSIFNLHSLLPENRRVQWYALLLLIIRVAPPREKIWKQGRDADMSFPKFCFDWCEAVEDYPTTSIHSNRMLFQKMGMFETNI